MCLKCGCGLYSLQSPRACCFSFSFFCASWAKILVFVYFPHVHSNSFGDLLSFADICESIYYHVLWLLFLIVRGWLLFSRWKIHQLQQKTSRKCTRWINCAEQANHNNGPIQPIVTFLGRYASDYAVGYGGVCGCDVATAKFSSWSIPQRDV